MRLAPARLAALGALLLGALPALGDEGKPVAIRWWGQAFVTIETFWMLDVAIDPYSLEIGYDDPGVEAELVLITHEHGDHSNAELVESAYVERGLAENGNARTLTTILDRAPNAPDPHLGSLALCDASTLSPHAVWVTSIPSFHDDAQGAKRGQNAMFLVQADGIRVLHCGDLGQESLTDEQLEAIGEVDVMAVPVGGVYTIDGERAAAIVDQVRPRFVLPIHYKTDALKIDLQTLDGFLAALPEKYERVYPVGNTFAASKGNGPTRDEPVVVVPKYTPWEMPQELSALFAIKEKDAHDSQAVYRPLTAHQLNFRPSNGTHTPRWNVEHTTSTEQIFFSSVFHNVDPSVPLLRERPAQMPPDYEPAHPDWDGAEEARTIERAQAFSRRFAYLLDGMPLDELPEGAPRFVGDLEGLFDRMINHYSEHTAHVKEKFELADWPDE